MEPMVRRLARKETFLRAQFALRICTLKQLGAGADEDLCVKIKSVITD